MKNIKQQFPFFKLAKRPLIYFDNAATTQRPQVVLDAMHSFYTTMNANPGRGVYQEGEAATTVCNDVRSLVQKFINARKPEEIIFTRGATDSINIIAQTWGVKNIQAGDEIVVTELEHHANFVPWQQLAQKVGATFKVIPLDQQGNLVQNWHTYISSKTKLLAVTHVSNALGLTNELLPDMIAKAHDVGARVLVDGAQAVGYQKVDIQALGADFYVFSGHKMFGPTGIGILYVKEDCYQKMEPCSFGGGAVFEVFQEVTTLRKPPYCYEPGTASIAEIVGLGAAIQFLDTYRPDQVGEHANRLVNQFLDGIQDFKEIHILGEIKALRKGSHLVSFLVEPMHAHDVAAYLDKEGIAVRAGNHCAQPVAHALGYNASVRVSFSLYNTQEEVDSLLTVLRTMLR